MASPPHLLHIFPTFATGGVQTVMLRVFNHLKTRWQHTILSLDGRFEAASRLQRGLKVSLADGRPVTGLFARRRHLASLRPDLIITYNWGSMDWLAAHVLRRFCPHVHAEHGFGLDEAFRRHLRRTWARRLLLRRVEAVVVPSQNLAELARREWWVPAARIVRIANGVEVCRAPLPRHQQTPPVVGTLAPLRPEKRIDRLLRIVDRLPDPPGVRLVIAGDGPERSALEQLAERLAHPQRVHFLGEVSQPERFLLELDVFALTSATEQLPVSVLEAMAAGLPVVAFAVGDLHELVAPENRPYIVPQGDEAAFAAALSALLGSASVRHAIGAANRNRQQQMFTVERMAGAYDELWRQLLATFRHSAN